MKILYILLFLILTGCILTHSDLSLMYASIGLDLWFNKMVPTLFPFMILSGIMVRMHLTSAFSKLLYPVIKPLYRISENACYAMIIGYLCGFPMGAKTISDLLKREMLPVREAEFLLAFCNNIGPVYFAGYVLPLLNRQLILPYIIGMYGIPLLYGLLLRYTVYRDLGLPDAQKASESSSHSPRSSPKLLNEVDASITSSVQSILNLGGYMILCNLLNLVFHILLGEKPSLIAPLLEITGGLKLSGGKFPLYCLLLLPFGGFSCIAQTNSCIRETPLSINRYVMHRLFLTLLTVLYYLGWHLLFPASFLR